MKLMLNLLVTATNSVFKVFTLIIPEEIIRREKPLKQFRREVPVWMDEEYL